MIKLRYWGTCSADNDPCFGRPPSTSFKCLGVGASTTLLPASGYTDIKKLGEQKGILDFDAKHRHQRYRVGVNNCSATIVLLACERSSAAG